jgi:hypothetical protein
MSEQATHFGDFESFIDEHLKPEYTGPDPTPAQVEAAFSFMKSVELYWADHIDTPGDDYPDEFTDEEWEGIRKGKVERASHINVAWGLVLEGNAELVRAVSELENSSELQRERWTPWDTNIQLDDGTLRNWEYHGHKSDLFAKKIIPLLPSEYY